MEHIDRQNSRLNSLRLAAENGDGSSQCELGCVFLYGEGLTQDDSEAIKWFRMAAHQGHANAQAHLSFCYFNGRGVKKDDAEAYRWAQLAAEQGHPLAQYYLGLHYMEGRGVERSDGEAVKWLRKAYLSGKPAAWSEAKEALKFTEPNKEYRCPKCLSTNVEVGYAYMFKYECMDCGEWVIAPSSMDPEASDWDNPGYRHHA